jgi:uncharacterized protein YdeI (YjbR/CyaY-like superfamily)
MKDEVDVYLNDLKKWQAELKMLREIILECGLTEDFKWMHPCYTDKGKNIVLIHGFKNYCAILFNKGSLLKDPKSILVQQTENTQFGRQIRFTDLSEIEVRRSVIKQYIKEAIHNERSNIPVPTKQTAEYEVPEELMQKFEEQPSLEKAFNKLTPGRQRGYLLHFGQPKQSKTIIARIDKNAERILNGFGLNDCVCGHSKRMPNCDGSHNKLKKQ